MLKTRKGDVLGTRTIIRRPELLALLGVSNTTLWSWIRDGRFPRPIDLGVNTRAWLTSEIDEFLQQRADERKAS